MKTGPKSAKNEIGRRLAAFPPGSSYRCNTAADHLLHVLSLKFHSNFSPYGHGEWFQCPAEDRRKMSKCKMRLSRRFVAATTREMDLDRLYDRQQAVLEYVMKFKSFSLSFWLIRGTCWVRQFAAEKWNYLVESQLGLYTHHIRQIQSKR